MTLIDKAKKFMRDPVGVTRRRIKHVWLQRKYADAEYNAANYWGQRLNEYGSDLRGPGEISASHTENTQAYEAARDVFFALCDREAIDFPNAKILEIGTGNGYYVEQLFQHGAKHYMGIDITDAMFNSFRERFPGFAFQLLDACHQPLPSQYDVIIMIDVTQHITNPDDFSYAMQNVKQHLASNGVFIVTSYLTGDKKLSFYEVTRSIKTYQAEFEGWMFGTPIPFHKKYLFTIRQG